MCNRLVVGSNPTPRAMELEEFITKTLTSIYSGVTRANKSVDTKSGDSLPFELTPEDSRIEFDIAVTVTYDSTDKVHGGVDIKVVSLGANAENKNEQQNSSRVKFKVRITRPVA